METTTAHNSTSYNQTNFLEKYPSAYDAVFIPSYHDSVTDTLVGVDIPGRNVCIYNSVDELYTPIDKAFAVCIAISKELKLIGETLSTLGAMYSKHPHCEPTLKFIPCDTHDPHNVTIVTLDDEPNVHIRYVDHDTPGDASVEIPIDELIPLGQLLVDIAENSAFNYEG